MNCQQGMHACPTLEDRGFEAVKYWEFCTLLGQQLGDRERLREKRGAMQRRKVILIQEFVDGVPGGGC